MNEREINAWLGEQRTRLSIAGMKSFSISIHDDETGFAGAYAYDAVGEFHCTRGETITEAHAKLRAKIPADPRESLRAEAARLLAKADAIDKEAAQ